MSRKISNLPFEAVPAKLSACVTGKLPLSTISIVGDPGRSGQLPVTADVFGIFEDRAPSFAKRYNNFNEQMKQTFAQYAKSVE
jgi:ketopantoate hydroxymethyltransferase